VLRSYRYQLQPTAKQTHILAEWVERTRELYNASLQERRDAWRMSQAKVTLYDQMAELPGVREVRPEYQKIPIIVLRGALRRLDRAYQNFFRRCRSSEKPGYPRFRGRGRFDSILIDDLGKTNPLNGNRIAVPFLGTIKTRVHRPLGGIPKAMRLTRDAGGRWFITLACEDVPAKPLPATGLEVGIDLGLTSFIATSDGDNVPRQGMSRDQSRKIARAQRRVSRRKRGSARRRRAVRLLRKEHARVAARRRERSILLARALVAKYDRIYVENLNVRGLASGMLAKSVNDAAWGDFLHWLRVKAEEAGRKVVEVDPRGTSQICSGCGSVVKKTLADREHRCPNCGLVLDRDVNAAINILTAGRAVRGAAPLTRGRRRSAKSKSPRRSEHTENEVACGN